MLPRALARALARISYTVAVVGLAQPQVYVYYQQFRHWVQLQPSKRGPRRSQLPSPKESSEAPPPQTPSDWPSLCLTLLLQRRKTDQRPSCRQFPPCQRVSLLAIYLVPSLVLLFSRVLPLPMRQRITSRLQPTGRHRLPFLTLCCFKSSTSRITAQDALCRHTLSRTTSRQARRDPLRLKVTLTVPGDFSTPLCRVLGPCLSLSLMKCFTLTWHREDDDLQSRPSRDEAHPPHPTPAPHP